MTIPKSAKKARRSDPGITVVSPCTQVSGPQAGLQSSSCNDNFTLPDLLAAAAVVSERDMSSYEGPVASRCKTASPKTSLSHAQDRSHELSSQDTSSSTDQNLSPVGPCLDFIPVPEDERLNMSHAATDIVTIREGLKQELAVARQDIQRLLSFVERGERVLSGLEGLLAASELHTVTSSHLEFQPTLATSTSPPASSSPEQGSLDGPMDCSPPQSETMICTRLPHRFNRCDDGQEHEQDHPSQTLITSVKQTDGSKPEPLSVPLRNLPRRTEAKMYKSVWEVS